MRQKRQNKAPQSNPFLTFVILTRHIQDEARVASRVRRIECKETDEESVELDAFERACELVFAASELRREM
jgi:hypothetical protein